MSKASEQKVTKKKPSPIQAFWSKHVVEDKVDNVKCAKALKKHFDEIKLEEKEEFKENEYRDALAKRIARQVFWPKDTEKTGKSPHVTKASILFACKTKTFGPWSTLIETIHQYFFEDTTTPATNIMDSFFGRAHLEYIDKKLINHGDYCLRYHDEAGFELCMKKNAKDGVKIVQEQIVRKKFKASGLKWYWEEKIAKVGGCSIKKHNFDKISDFIKEVQKQIKTKPVMFLSPYTGEDETKVNTKDFENALNQIDLEK